MTFKDLVPFSIVGIKEASISSAEVRLQPPGMGSVHVRVCVCVCVCVGLDKQT